MEEAKVVEVLQSQRSITFGSEKLTRMIENEELDENAPLLSENLIENENRTNTNMVKPEIAPAPKLRSYSTNPLSLSEAVNGDMLKMPSFNYDAVKKREIEFKFIESHYIGLGYNREPRDDKKHYRYLLEEELEKTIYFGESALDVFNIQKGQSRGLGSSDKDTGDSNTIRSAGKFKGLVRIQGDYSSTPDPDFEKIAKTLLVKTEVLVRVYVVNALNLVQKDRGSASDPYLVLSLGGNKISDRANHINDNPNPDFNRSFEFSAILPGDSMLKVQVYDYDDLLPDDKIGSTKIDLEDRYFSTTWSSISEKPVETRALYTKSNRSPQGFVKL